MMGLSTAVLAAINGGVCHLAGLVEHLGRDKRAIVKAVQVLKRRELVAITPPGRGDAPHYALTEAGRQQVVSGVSISPGQGERPRKKTAGLRERAWWEIRSHKLATLKQITTTHADGTEKAADVNLYKYLAALEKAGILSRAAKNRPARQSKGRVLWLLVIDLGPEAPVWRQRAQEIYDPNSGKVYPMAKDAADALALGQDGALALSQSGALAVMAAGARAVVAGGGR